MASRVREAVAPAYLFLCHIAGGSAQGIWANMVLQLLGIAIIGWAAMSRSAEPAPARALFGIVLAALALVALQLVPLPASVWPHVGGREAIASGYRVLGIAVPAVPVSLAPYDSLQALLTLIPPIAMLCAMLRLKAYRPAWLALALLGGTFCGILLGVLQVASGNPLTSPWYLYPDVSFGFATGFFANANHMAILLVVGLPFVAALLAAARGASRQRQHAVAVMAAGATLVLVVGIALNGSLAGYGLAVPLLAASALIVMPARSPLIRWVAIFGGLFLIVAVGVLESSSTRPNGFGAEAASSVESREDMLATTWAAARNFLPLGSGVGTFRRVYDLYDDHDRVTGTYVVHAHNDYAELLLEAGIPGLAILILFLAWWGRAAWRAWSSAEAGPFARAASIASAAILVHSLVDFPLRTAAISAAFAMCLSLLADRRAVTASATSDLRPTRHIVLG
jgi:O-antigen ligase